MMAAPVKTLGGWPAAVKRAATSALRQLISMQPPTVDPGATGVSSPGTRTMASPAGAPVSGARLGKYCHVFQEHGLPLAIGAHDWVMKCEGQLDNGIEARKGTVAWPHFLDHDPGMSGAEDVHHAASKDGFREPIGSLLDDGILGSDCLNEG